MSAPTNPQLLADYTSGRIDYATYQKTMADANAALKYQQTQQALINSGVSQTLIASELALAKAGYASSKTAAQRRYEQQQAAAKKRAAQLAAQQAQLDATKAAQAAANALQQQNKVAEAQAVQAQAAAAAQALATQQQAERAQMDAVANAEAARVKEAEMSVSAIAAAAQQKMIEETGRHLAPELEGFVLASAIEYVEAIQAYDRGEREEPVPDRVIGYDASLFDQTIRYTPVEVPYPLPDYPDNLVSDPYTYTPTAADLIGGGESEVITPTGGAPVGSPPSSGDDAGDNLQPPSGDVISVPESMPLSDLVSPARLGIAALVFLVTGIWLVN